MRQDLNTLRNKRKECDEDFDRLRKRMHSCENAMKELPNSSNSWTQINWNRMLCCIIECTEVGP